MSDSELESLHRQLRRAEFTQEMLATILRLERPWRKLRTSDPLAYVQGRCVAAEVLDYFGWYDRAEEALEDEDVEALDDLFVSSFSPEGLSPSARQLWKRRIWLAAAKAQVHYRRDDYGSTDTTLRTSEEALDRLNPFRDQHFGTRAHLAHFRGQLERQRGEYVKASRFFEAACIWATKQFTSGTPCAEIREPVRRERSLGETDQPRMNEAIALANWTIGKSITLGLGWIAMTTGRLTAAETLLHVGYAQLRGTGDYVHRAYAVLLLGTVERARSRAGQEGIDSAILKMNDAKNVLKGHPFELRCGYELAQAYLRQGDLKAARGEIHETLTSLAQSSRREDRWRCNALVVHSRIERAAGDYSEAARLATLAGDLAWPPGSRPRSGARPRYPDGWVEAEIARGEACVQATGGTAEVRREQLAMALSAFRNARGWIEDNPKTLAVVHLHLAGALHRLNRRSEAREAQAEASKHLSQVEHGFVAELAERVANELGKGEAFFIPHDLRWFNPETSRYQGVSADELVRRLQSFIARRDRELEVEDPARHRELRLNTRTRARWEKR